VLFRSGELTQAKDKCLLAQLDGYGIHPFIGSLNVWEAFLGFGFNINVTYAQERGIVFNLAFELVTDVLINVFGVAEDLKARDITVLLNEVAAFLDVARLKWFNYATIQSRPLALAVLTWNEQSRIVGDLLMDTLSVVVVSTMEDAIPPN
jgi:hypothetical protein